MLKGKCIGVIVSKLDMHRGAYRGYIAMLAVDKEYRKRGIGMIGGSVFCLLQVSGSQLVKKSVQAMEAEGCEEVNQQPHISCKCLQVVLETEVTNSGALALYLNLGFLKDKRLSRYYMNGVDAFRLKLFLETPIA